MDRIDGGVTAPKGFQAAGVYAGIKKAKKDMAMIYSEVPAVAAGVFTTNLVKAAPVKWDQKVVKESPYVQAAVINSGVANACTGLKGFEHCEEMANKTAQVLNIPEDSVLVASTGVIGKQLPIDIIKAGIESLGAVLGKERADSRLAAEAIMTTDLKAKEVAVKMEMDGTIVTLGGMCKGSGMIHPNMATMLCFLTTDANITKEMLQKALSRNVKDTFNMISVDGDTSTNDTVVIMANGLAKNTEISAEDSSFQIFYQALDYIMTELSKKIAGDGEGATCLFEVTVINGKNKEQAVTLSKAIVTSSLVKTAVFGHDANWGRILCAMGYSGAQFDPDTTDLYFESSAGKIQIVKDGMGTDYSEEEAKKILSAEAVTAIADIKQGTAKATAWGCDLTLDYVKINADYRS